MRNCVVWRNNKLLHGRSRPARIQWNELWQTMEFYNRGRRHRLGGPAVVLNGNEIYRVEYWYSGNLHRVKGPAMISYFNGELIGYVYSIRGKKHRNGAPAEYSVDGFIETYKYYQHGVLHRSDGPARYSLIEDDVIEEEYFLRGVRVDREALRRPAGQLAAITLLPQPIAEEVSFFYSFI